MWSVNPRVTSAAHSTWKLRRFWHVGLAVLAVLLIALPGTATGAGAQPLSAQPPQAQPQSPDATCPPDGQCFADVLASNPFFAFINRIYQQDLVTGYPCGGTGEPCDSYNRPYYRPGNPVTRGQMSKFIDNARRLPQIHIETASPDPAIYISSTVSNGLYAQTYTATAIYGNATGGGIGVRGDGGELGVYGTSTGGYGVWGVTGTGTGVIGNGTQGEGIYGGSQSNNGIHGYSSAASGGVGVLGRDDTTAGVEGTSTNGWGVWGVSSSNYGVFGSSSNGAGVNGTSTSGTGVVGINSTGGIGVSGNGDADGVYGQSPNGFGAYGFSPSGTGVEGDTTTGTAGFFHGHVTITGGCTGCAGPDTIDDPVDPTGKFLNQSSVQSSDMMDIYNGNVTTDANGDATITMPSWFQALNRDFRYQLTPIGQFAQAMVSSEIKDNSFSIKTDKPNVKVSWQVTGIRQDPFSTAQSLPVEQPKPAGQQGKYLHPTEYGQPASSGIYQSQQQQQSSKP